MIFNNKPVDMCQVEIYACYYGVTTLCERTITDKSGMFFIDGISSGIYIIRAENNMFYYKEKICLRPGVNALNIYPIIKPKMMYGTISGVIVDSEGNRVKDALVVLQRKDGKLIKFTRTNSQGEYLFYNVERGEYSIITCAKKEQTC
ncbi:carboxypeptidase-like regulatory domain-containing protein [Caloramator sp. mosi_1]|uniref:carboxypeptidase-like regulatory domain-containing protein n=1 Tax=Caloramator sp. mosi_1 TaxID=3023090 RepID=UPI002362711F|nr:carboxypeptidase-like regulatory domain-containing protein [Caloramator sp. mosi_1]WDC84616.1 carboxypeptidase-like regulatory domain-containing protein [Caloramator sp. mosi_1]